MLRKIFFKLCLLFLLTGAQAVGADAQDAGGNPWMSHAQKAIDEYKAKNYPAFLDHAEKAARSGPVSHPQLLYHLARALSLNGRNREAAKILDRLAEMGLGVDAAENSDFKSLRGSAEWAELGKKIAAARAPVVRSRAEFTVAEPDLLPEGVAYDPRSRTFYLGGNYKSKIVSLDAQGRRREFKTSGEDGLRSVLGMKVDAGRRLLWVCNNTRDGAAFVHKYDLASGRLIKKYALDEKPVHHQFNDLAFDSRGNLYVTDSLAAAVYEIPAETDRLRLLVKLEEGVYPNGIALSKNERRLYVATFAGISMVDVGARTHTELGRAETIATAGADGLYLYEDSLIAVQNANPAPDRVVRLFLNAEVDRVERARVIESNHPLYAIPTTGVVVGGDFVYIANTHLDSLTGEGKLSPAATLSDVVLLKVSLN
jgi:sugar lactone lactonase YvrE